jgi:serine/threonine-protein kinase PknG
MTAAACARPGCSGTIEDGYCDICGLAPDAAQPNLVGVAAPSGSPWQGGSTGLDSSTGTGGSAGSGSSVSSRGSRSSGGTRSTGASSRGFSNRLVEVPPVAAIDPSSAILSDPKVPESRRFCGNCERLVGQSRDGLPGVTDGFCPNCRTRFSFTPKLEPGELVYGQYEVLGCLAHGGLGWIYLAKDHNVSDRWVVLKGLLNTGDADALSAALAERRFLAEVEHPNIVKIYNFVQHTSRRDGETSGYIVMEYVGGKSLKQIRQEARQRGGVVPLAHALAYALEILPAFGYLHDRGLVYCDFKPDNVIQTEGQLKLIDMGGVRHVDDEDSPIYGTKGYQAPEVGTEGPSPTSDLYTVGRSLAVLTFDFIGYQGQYEFRLPESEPLLARQPSFARLLRRATHADPGRRFQSAAEMAEQLTGVLREVVSAATGEHHPATSRMFSPPVRAVGTDFTAVPAADGGTGTLVSAPSGAEMMAGLPAPLTDGTDPAAGYLASLAGLPPAQQAAALDAAVAGGGGVPKEVAESPETRLALVRALLTGGDSSGAAAQLAEFAAAAGQEDWRVAWYTGLRLLADGSPEQARASFAAVYDELPGEVAPKLALGFAAEAVADLASARHFHELVWTLDQSWVSAAFGLARACLAGGDRTRAIAVVKAVPSASSQHVPARIAAVRLLLGGAGVSAADLREAADLLSELKIDVHRKQELTIELLRAALGWVGALPAGLSQNAPLGPGARILGHEPDERGLRLGLERAYRDLAGLTPEQARRIELVDLANSIRPRTLI